MNKIGYISVEIIVIASIIIIGGLIGVTKYSSKGKETTSKTTDKVEQTVAFAGEISNGSGKNDNSNDNNSSNNTIKTDGINLLNDADNILLTHTDNGNTAPQYDKNKLTIISNDRFNLYNWVTLKDMSVSDFSKENYQKYYKFSIDIKTKNLSKEGIVAWFDFRDNTWGNQEINILKIDIKPNKDNEWQTLQGIVQLDNTNYSYMLVCIDSLNNKGYEGVEIEYKNIRLEKVIS